jgi:hypothetical protein
MIYKSFSPWLKYAYMFTTDPCRYLIWEQYSQYTIKDPEMWYGEKYFRFSLADRKKFWGERGK